MNISLTLILVIMTSLISYNAFTNRELYSKLLFHPFTIKTNGEYSRFITHGFVHADMNHLLINMFVLYMFGEGIEYYFIQFFGPGMGRVAFLLLYLGGVIFSSIFSFVKHQNHSYYSAVGASGGTSAIVFSSILFNPWGWFYFPPLPAILFGVGYLFYSSYMGKKGGDNIGHDAHFWGAVYGLVITLVLCFILRPAVLDFILSQFMSGPEPPPFF